MDAHKKTRWSNNVQIHRNKGTEQEATITLTVPEKPKPESIYKPWDLVCFDNKNLEPRWRAPNGVKHLVRKYHLGSPVKYDILNLDTLIMSHKVPEHDLCGVKDCLERRKSSAIPKPREFSPNDLIVLPHDNGAYMVRAFTDTGIPSAAMDNYIIQRVRIVAQDGSRSFSQTPVGPQFSCRAGLMTKISPREADIQKQEWADNAHLLATKHSPFVLYTEPKPVNVLDRMEKSDVHSRLGNPRGDKPYRSEPYRREAAHSISRSRSDAHYSRPQGR